MVLETRRLWLAPWQPDDWRTFRAIASDPKVMRYIGEGKPWPDERTRQFVARQVALFSARQFCLWKLVAKDEGALIGFCGIQPLEDTSDIEIGWWLARDRWGQGLATEAARAALRDAFERVGLTRVVAVAQPSNRASIRVMEKLGMKYERDAAPRGIPAVLYAISNPSLER